MQVRITKVRRMGLQMINLMILSEQKEVILCQDFYSVAGAKSKILELVGQF